MPLWKYHRRIRRVSFILERRLAREVIKGTLAPSEGAGYDMVGSGRSFDEKGFRDKLSEVEGYIISDVASFPQIPFWIIPKTVVEEWWTQGRLGTTTKVSRATALDILSSL